MNIKDFKWTEKRFGTRFAKILKGLGFSDESTEDIKVTDANGSVKTLVTDSNFKSILAKNGNLTEVTWQELKDKRDAGKLIPGALYRITDYQCTTTQGNTQSAGHQFDIVLLALSENKLAEEGWAMEHPTDMYDVTFSDGITLKCYMYCTSVEDNSWNIVAVNTLLGLSNIDGTNECSINEETKTVIIADGTFSSEEMTEENLTYNYFQNSNLSAWKVWYCLDNDTTRFAWATNVEQLIDVDSKYSNGVALKRYSAFDGGQLYHDDYYYAWGCSDDEDDGDTMDFLYSKTESLKAGDKLYFPDKDEFKVTNIGSITGRGVIYRLIDEFNNDIKYDFKNIQFKRKLTNGQYDATNGTDTWCYTLNIWYNSMCQDASIVGNTLLNDEGFVNGVYDNKFGYATAYDLMIEGVSTFAFALGDNVVLSTLEGDYYGFYSNTIGNSFTDNTIGSAFTNNVIGSNFKSNTIGNGFFSNTIGNEFNSNIIGNMFNSNIIGNMFNINTIGNNCYSNTIGNDFVSKTIGDDIGYKNYGNNGVELATKS